MSAPVIKLTPSILAGLLCSRICHDLISPVGALGTGIEILNDETNADMHEDAIDLIKNSSRQANAKLEFLRDAFGVASYASGFDGRTIQPFYAGMLARELQGSVETSVSEETVTFTAKTLDPAND